MEFLLLVTEHELKPDVLTTLLENAFPNANIDSAATERIGQGYGLASELYRCELEGKNVPQSVIAKLWETDGLGGENEVAFYSQLGSKLSKSIPKCYFGKIDKAQKRGFLLLEDFRDARQGDCTERSSFEEASRIAMILAEIHAMHWDNSDLENWDWLPAMRPLNISSEWHEPRRTNVIERFGELFDTFSRSLLDNSLEIAKRSMSRLEHISQTLVHGDLHLDNVLFDDQNKQIVLLDWASVVKSTPAIDLEVLLLDIAPLDCFDDLLEIYIDRVRELGVELDQTQLIQEIEAVLLRNFVRFTLGLANWPCESLREMQIARSSIQRMTEAVNHWNERNSELFNF